MTTSLKKKRKAKSNSPTRPGSKTAYWQTERSKDGYVSWKDGRWIEVSERPNGIWATGQTGSSSGGQLTIFTNKQGDVYLKEQSIASGRPNPYWENWYRVEEDE